MTRVLVVAVASLLATGCVVHDTCDARVVSIGWPTFRLASNAVVSTCRDAGIGDVDVFMDDKPVGTFHCSDGGVNVTGVLNDKDHLFTVEGIDAAHGTVALRDEVTVSPSNCTDLVVDTQPSEGTFELDYSISPGNVCSGSPSFIWFSLHDDISGDVIAFDETSGATTYQCGDTPSFALASGPYTLQRTEEVTFSGSTPVPQSANCNAAKLTIQGGQLQPVNVTLAHPSGFCP